MNSRLSYFTTSSIFYLMKEGRHAYIPPPFTRILCVFVGRRFSPSREAKKGELPMVEREAGSF